MNLQSAPSVQSLRVLILNPLSPCSRLIIMKIMSGAIFGKSQPIDLILLVYSNEKSDTESLKSEITACAFECMHSITVTIDLPRIGDADVFCIVTNFSNPNSFNYKTAENDEQFDMLYLVLKVANFWSKFPATIAEPEFIPAKHCKNIKIVKPFKPLIMTDGLVTLDIMKSISKTIPTELFFCPTPIPDVAENVIADYLKVRCHNVNKMRVWAADDQTFHIVVEEPVLRKFLCGDGEPCKWDKYVEEQMTRLNLDYTQFNDSWMKTTFVEKVVSQAAKNPYGNICRAAEFCKTLTAIWKCRPLNDPEFHVNVGIISDGSFNTLKGYPYVFPVIFNEDKWKVVDCERGCSQLMLEINRINKVVRQNHLKLISYCKDFLERNVINLEFAGGDQESSTYVSSDSSQLMRL